MNPIEIVPAILPKNIKEIEEKLFLVRGLVKKVQIDICDGFFVSNKTWPYNSSDSDVFSRIYTEREGLPFWQEFDFEVDLFVKKPEEVLERWISAGAKSLVIHLKSTENLEQIIKNINSRVEVGLGIETEGHLVDFEKYIPSVSFIQFMGIKKIGFQGQEFNQKVLEVIKETRSKYPDLQISIDGGVNLENAKKIIESGANKLIFGSAIFGSPDPRNSLSIIKKAF